MKHLKLKLFRKALLLIAFGIMPFIFSCSKNSCSKNGVEPTTHEEIIHLTPYRCYNNLYGFIDTITGEQVIECKYNWADEFNEGLAAVGLNNKHGFIDKTGNVIIPLKYDDVRRFNEGLAAVGLNNKWGFKWGFIDKTGNVIIPLKYDDVNSNFKNGKAKVFLNGETFCINKQDQKVGCD
jgi:hypothetical protein